MAEGEGFEPSRPLLRTYSLSRGAPSAARPSLRGVWSMDFKTAVDRYLVEVILPRQPKRRTLMKTKGEWALLVEHFGHDTPVAAIQTRDIADWRYGILARGLAGATVNRRQNDLRALLNKIKRWGCGDRKACIRWIYWH